MPDLGSLLTALSIFVGLVLGVFGFMQNREFQKRNLTVSMLGHFKLNQRLSDSDFRMTRLINSEQRLSGVDLPDDVDQFVINLLDYYEFLATAYEKGALDRPIILYARGGPMSRTFTVCEQYIKDRRKSLGAPNLYRNFENLVLDYRRQELGL